MERLKKSQRHLVARAIEDAISRFFSNRTHIAHILLFAMYYLRTSCTCIPSVRGSRICGTKRTTLCTKDVQKNNDHRYLTKTKLRGVWGKKRHPFYICYNLIRCHPFLPILGRNTLHEIWNKHKCTDNHVLFRMFVLYRVKSGNDFYGIQCLFQISWSTFLPKISRIG